MSVSASNAQLASSVRRLVGSGGPRPSARDLRDTNAVVQEALAGRPIDALIARLPFRGSTDAAAFLRRAEAPQLAAILDEAATAIGAHRHRTQLLSRASTYATLLALTAVVQGLLLLFAIAPLERLAGAEYRDADAQLSALPALIAAAVSVAALVCVAWDLRRAAAGWVLNRARTRQHRALGLALAAAANRAGTPLIRAIEAAADGVGPGKVRDELLAAAGALERGDVAPAAYTPLLGPLGGRLFAVAAARGEGDETLRTLAALEATRADLALPLVAAMADAIALALAGVAIACVGGAFYALYGRALLGG